mgnify:CR=1 FL=1
MGKLIECVPNFSEGRTLTTIDTLANIIQSNPELSFLDRQSDVDHNRSVLTFTGQPKAVENAAFQLAKSAKELIDIRKHQGVHPWIGATDIIPFVPLQPASTDACIKLAKSLGSRIATELAIPVFLYGKASQINHRAIEDIRRGSLSELTNRMLHDLQWAPDFGALTPHPTAGVMAIGVRSILVAFNVNLASTDLAVAKAIARTIRASNGGFKHVKAIGVKLESRGIVQVSMNLTNVEETPISPVFKAIEFEAKRYGATITESEIIGLIPEQAFKNTEGLELKLKHFRDDQILERRL